MIAEQTEEACDSTRKQVDSCGVVNGSERGISSVNLVVVGDLEVRVVAGGGQGGDNITWSLTT